MKKTILAFALMGCGAIAVAQDSLDYNTMNRTNSQTTTLQSNTNYQAFSSTATVPSTTQTFLLRDYPSAMDATWEQWGDWYRATYLDNNRNMRVYYAPNGNSYAVALPVINSWIPEEVITSALNQFGSNIYSINRMKAANGEMIYQVTVIENGVSRTEYIGLDGQPVTAVDVFLVPGVDLNTLQSSSSNAAMISTENDVMVDDSNADVNKTDNNVKTKTKVKHTNGHEIKSKTKNGKTRVKESHPDIMDQ